MPLWFPAVIWTLFGWCTLAFAADVPRADAGPAPAVRVFSARELGDGAMCTRAIVAHPDGKIYAATDRGVREFDGASWRAVTSAEQPVYALALDAGGRVWFAEWQRLGVIEAGSDGARAARYLDFPMPKEEQEGSLIIREAVALGDEVYFLLGKTGTIVRANTQGIVRAITIGKNATNLVPWDHAVHVQTRDLAYRIERDAAVPLPDVAPWRGFGVSGVRGGGVRADGRRWLFGVGVVRTLEADGVNVWKDFRTESGSRVRLSAATLLNDDTLAVGTTTEGVLLLDATGELRGRYGPAEGLGPKSDMVRALARDSQGRLWIGHEGGVAMVTRPGEGAGRAVREAESVAPRYTGLPQVRSFNESHTGGGPVNNGVAVSREGFVYLANQYGVLEFDGETWRMIPGTENQPVQAVHVGPDGRIWFGGRDTFGRLEPDKRGLLSARFLQELLPEADRKLGQIRQIVTHEGGVYLLAAGAGLVRVDAQDQVHLLRSEEILSPMFRAGGILRAPGARRCFRVGPAGLEIDPDANQALEVENLRGVDGVFRDEPGAVWLVCNRGIVELRGRSAPLVSASLPRALNGDPVSFTCALGDGRVAVASATRGVFIVDGDGRVLGNYDEDHGLGFGVATVTGMAMDADGGLWIAHRGGATRVQVRTPVALHGPALGLRGAVNDVALHRGKLYAATGHGVFVRDPVAGRFARVPNASPAASALLPTEEGLLVFGDGVARLDDADRVISIEQFGQQFFTAARLLRDPDTIVASTRDTLRVYQRTNGRWSFRGKAAATRGDELNPLVADAEGWVWAILNLRQLVRLDWRKGVRLDAPLERIGPERGVEFTPAGTRLFLLEGVLHVANPAGFYRHDPATDRFARIEMSIPGRESRSPSRHLYPIEGGALWMRAGANTDAIARPSPSGGWKLQIEPFAGIENVVTRVVYNDVAGRMLWIGAPQGLVSVDLDAVRRPDPPPAVRVRRVTNAAGEVIWGGAGPPPKLRLDAAQNSLQFHFAAPAMLLDSNAVPPVTYRSYLEGFEPPWGTPQSRVTTRTYTNLPPGKYDFNVGAKLGESRRGPGAHFSFEVLAPWWRTWWFLGLASVTGIGSVAGVTRWFANRALKRRVELLEAQSAVERERLRLARDLHDEVGSGLGRVILFAGEADRSKNDPQKLESSLARVRQSAQDLVQHAREIVWAVSPQHDTLASVIERLGDYAEETLRSAGIACAVERPSAEKIPRITLGSEARHSLFLAVKEAVHNAVKYSEAKTTEFRLEISGNDFVITLRDHGRGFAPGEKRGSGHGTKNIVARAEALGGRAEITSEVGKGTTVMLRVPLVKGGAV